MPRPRARPRPAASSPSPYALIWAAVRRIPRGRVATYGQVAAAAGLPGRARQVGYALHALAADAEDVPWQRVVNARGEISLGGACAARQRELLADEGVELDEGRIDLARYQWRPRARPSPPRRVHASG